MTLIKRWQMMAPYNLAVCILDTCTRHLSNLFYYYQVPAWKARFGYECVSAVVEGTLTSRAPKYSTILELDRKIRDVELPVYARGESPKSLGLAETMSHFMPHNYRELSSSVSRFLLITLNGTQLTQLFNMFTDVSSPMPYQVIRMTQSRVNMHLLSWRAIAVPATSSIV